jgi:eukaryotic-like serine/threonine-protein kinase
MNVRRIGGTLVQPARSFRARRLSLVLEQSVLTCQDMVKLMNQGPRKNDPRDKSSLAGSRTHASGEDTIPLPATDGHEERPTRSDSPTRTWTSQDDLVSMPDDLVSTKATPGKPGASVVEKTEEALLEAAKNSTNLDTLVARLVVDNGLALEEEVQQCLSKLKQLRDLQQAGPSGGSSTGGPNQGSLMQLLVDNDYITRRQVARLKQIAEAERQGHKIPGYKFLGKLGAGAMATVHKAKQLSLDRLVAIKILPKKFTTNPQFIERFYAEGRAAAQLNHPNIVQAFDVGKAGEYHYFVMEFVDGRTVYDDIVKHKRYGEKDAIEIAMQTAEALQHAHERGLIHRDVKPKNVMITKEGIAKLADMGLARAVSDKEAAEAEAGKAFGTPYYISPEQIRGEMKIGAPADIYSLGATLYHMVTGNVPFDGSNPSAVMHKHLKSELVPPDHVNPKLSAGIAEVIEMMMAKDPKKRYQHCKDLLVDLKALRKGETPPIAHKDMPPAVDVASIMKAEASAHTEIASAPEPHLNAGTMLRQPLVIGLAAALFMSLIANVVFFLIRGD